VQREDYQAPNKYTVFLSCASPFLSPRKCTVRFRPRRIFVSARGRTQLFFARFVDANPEARKFGERARKFLNPVGSVKDRSALGIVLDAEASGGAFEPAAPYGGQPAGNTGYWPPPPLSFWLKCAGYRTVSIRRLNQGRLDGLRAWEAEVEPFLKTPTRSDN